MRKLEIKNGMAATATNDELLEYFTQLDEAEKESILQLLKTFIKGKKQLAHCCRWSPDQRYFQYGLLKKFV